MLRTGYGGERCKNGFPHPSHWGIPREPGQKHAKEKQPNRRQEGAMCKVHPESTLYIKVGTVRGGGEVKMVKRENGRGGSSFGYKTTR